MRSLQILLKQLLFWMLFFAVQRGIFIAYYIPEITRAEISISEILETFIHALSLDLSTASYILIIPAIILFLSASSQNRRYDWWINAYNQMLIVLIILIDTGELGLYKEWNSKLSYKALLYLKNPSEVLSSARTADLISYCIMIIIQVAVFRFLYRKYASSERIASGDNNRIKNVLFMIPILGLLFVGIRGGVQQIPISISQVYFSNHTILNESAVNPTYNLVFSLTNYSGLESFSSFHFMPDEEARRIVDQLHHADMDSTRNILNDPRPNVVILFLESWSGDLIESLGGISGVTPRFHELEKEGILFTNFFSGGNRSQQALASVFSGFPAIPFTTLTSHPQKYTSFQSLVKILKNEGYHSSFYFGGDLNYGNIKSYLISNEFDELIDQNDFSEDALFGKLGAHDQYLFEKMIGELNAKKEPFFTSALTLSSHSPYDQPGDRPLKVNVANDYLNSVWYTDRCLGDFIRKAKNATWYDNTIFLIMSDHSHPSFKEYPMWSFDYRKIPLLILGGALKKEFRGTINERIASNVDVTSTLLRQLGLSDKEFYWSKNLFNPFAPQFAYFETDWGYGWKTPQGQLEYHVLASSVLTFESKEIPLLQFKKEGDAYVQSLFGEFLDR